ncbi:MAG: hypothetical protein HC939_16920 [Pleurocapsa sp. SU_5_0]|nr:hypothetical protein [Pleurocapsa sp. SU_5_0]
MPKGNPKGNPDILMATAEVKRKDALERTEKAIAELVKTGASITFKSIAEKAGVSVPYLYKYDELKERIQHLRSQQKKQVRKRTRRPQSFQPASDNSKQLIIQNLKEDNKKLRGEIDKQKKHIEVVQGKLYELSRVAEENNRLRQQLNQITAELATTKKQLDDYLLANPSSHPKVTSIDSKRKPITSVNDELKSRLDELKSRLSELGVRMNATLKR